MSPELMLARLLRLPPRARSGLLQRLSKPQRRELFEGWWLWSMPAQREPRGDWRVWLIRAGRGFGKTRAGAEWVSAMARALPEAQIALVGATLDDAHRVMVGGSSGLIAVAREGETIEWHPSTGVLRFASGAVATVFSAGAPEKLRGPSHDFAWCDELGKWKGEAGEAAWHNLAMTMRGCEDARTLVTTTPRQTRLMRLVRAGTGFVETLGRTRDNPHLPASFVEAMLTEYDGTWQGRQELDGEMIDEVAGALWSRELIEACRVREAAALVRVVIGVDPPASAGGDACGIIAAGLGRDGIGYVLEDASLGGASPEGWAHAVAACAARWHAERVVAEKNQGGEMVASVLLAADAGLPVSLVHASRGKAARAEPVSLLYERGRVKHAGAWGALEDELCGLQIGGGYEGPGRSPDRADALVWALSALMLERHGEPGIRLLS